MWGSACQEGDSGGGGLADVTLTETRGDHVGVSGKPEPQKPVSPSHLLYFYLPLKGLSICPQLIHLSH